MRLDELISAAISALPAYFQPQKEA